MYCEITPWASLAGGQIIPSLPSSSSSPIWPIKCCLSHAQIIDTIVFAVIFLSVFAHTGGLGSMVWLLLFFSSSCFLAGNVTHWIMVFSTIFFFTCTLGRLIHKCILFLDPVARQKFLSWDPNKFQSLAKLPDILITPPPLHVYVLFMSQNVANPTWKHVA